VKTTGLTACPATLEGLQHTAHRRILSRQRGIDFASNDFLALANSPRLKAAIIAATERGVPVGSGGSRLLRGNHPEHEGLEEEAAVFSTLPQRGDLILHDALIHASVQRERPVQARCHLRSIEGNLDHLVDEGRDRALHTTHI